ncbi:serine hydrolase [Paucibacter sediminis]|uniref:Serine hydrolase n=1 Tax=Paucibacter sediminis TaxID=3019553 RepID=A0AA95N8P8_9BURK|nr:serine hydrolase domain-containing protein [Paucibacter sp. S2-9]WIT10650.1 serine hydrolase [Paucibacter sp. S2-9]
MPFAKPRLLAIATVFLLSLPGLNHAAGSLEEANVQARGMVLQKMKERRIPGLQVAVVKDDRVVLSESYGLANVENQVPATAKTLFPINSATKAFTGVAVMQMAEAGLVDLDAPISRYLDDLPEAWRRIRVRQLLAHTSGLPDIVEQPGPVAGGTEAGMWKAVRQQPMDAPIGEKFAYNQTNYGLLAQIIVKQTKMPYERYLAERQFAVADMRLTSFGDSYDIVPSAATIYSHFPRRTLAPDDAHRLSHWFYDIPYSLRAGGGIQTTADELARWLTALTNGRLLSAASMRSMWTAEKLNSGTDADWAAGWPVLASAPRRQVAGIGGNRAAFIVYPDEGLAVIVLTNMVGGNPELFIPQIAELYRSLPKP